MTLRRTLAFDEIAGLCLALHVPLKRLLEGRISERVNVGADSISLHELEDAMRTGVVRPTDAQRRVEIAREYEEAEYDRNIARNMGVSDETLADASERLFGTPFVVREVFRRTEGITGSPSAINVKVGHVVRQVMNRIKQEIEGAPSAAEVLAVAEKAAPRKRGKR